jgi:ferredoxin
MEMETVARLLSVNVGLPRDIAWQGKTVHTAVWKTTVQGRRMARRLNLDGDGQGDLVGHDGEHLTGRCVALHRLHTENFGSGPSMTPGVAAALRPPPHPPEEASKIGPLVSFTRSNLAVHWGSTFRSLLELAEACDVPVRWSCRTGVCHNCETGLISGSVIYGPDPVEPPANGNLLICCSQPRDDVALDL